MCATSAKSYTSNFFMVIRLTFNPPSSLPAKMTKSIRLLAGCSRHYYLRFRKKLNRTSQVAFTSFNSSFHSSVPDLCQSEESNATITSYSSVIEVKENKELLSLTEGDHIDEKFMKYALNEAMVGKLKGEVPVGAIIVLNGELIASAYNR